MIQEFYLSLIFSCLLLADLKIADMGSTNENTASPNGTATPPLWRDLVKILDTPHLFPWNALISKM
jgi:hypothetical protein